jgi:hypothetical protein
MTQKKKSKMGRPKLPKDEKRKVFSLRVSKPEWERISHAAKKAGEPETRWARKALLAAAG